MMYVLNFCGACGRLTRPGTPRCAYCGSDITTFDRRIQGEFYEHQARALYKTHGLEEELEYTQHA
jgi:uncharacterized OB-fold protein